MSEFQCYKFKTIDRPLNDSEKQAVNDLSSRGHVTSTSATFIYHYSDFRHNAATVLEKYFDAHLYFSNWGTKKLMFRLPAKLVDAKALWKYCYEDKWGSNHITVRRREEYYILEMLISDEEGGGWMEEDDYDLGDFARIREDILNGDYRALYLLWVKFSSEQFDEDEEGDNDELEEDDKIAPPPVPPNLKKLTSALKSFIDFFEIDTDLVSAAQAASKVAVTPVYDYENLLSQLPNNEQLDWLKRLLKGEQRLEVQLKKRLERLENAPPPPPTFNVTSAQLIKQSKVEEKNRLEREAEAAKAAHIAKMKKLAAERAIHWKSVTFNLDRKTGKSYDLATEVLKDLKELAIYEDDLPYFQKQIFILKEKYGRSRVLIQRWEKAGLFQ